MKWIIVSVSLVCLIIGAVIGYNFALSDSTGLILTVDNLNAIPTVEAGSKIVWKDMPAGSISFYPHYAPCNPTGDPPGCKVPKELGTGYYPYKIAYPIASTPGSTVRTGFGALRVVRCPHCPGTTGNPPPPGSERRAASPGTIDPPPVALLCQANKASSVPTSVQVNPSSAVEWIPAGPPDPNWTVEFKGNSPCTKSSKFGAGHDTCDVADDATGNYTYDITLPGTANCSPGQGTLTVTHP